MSVTTSFTVANQADLNAAIQAIDLTGADSAANTAYTITFTGDLSGANALNSDLTAINLASGSSLTIYGGGHALDGGGVTRGLFVYAGTVTVNDLTIENAVATGGAGGDADGSGGGGGAGLGGGLFVASAGTVTLNNVNFSADLAVGGAGGHSPGTGGSGGGGGGMGGAGGAAYDQNVGGGGGVGTAADGGSAYAGGGYSSGQKGIIQGAAGGGGSDTGTVGGADGGGGGGGFNYAGGGGVGGAGGTADGAGGFGGGAGGNRGTGGTGGFGGGASGFGQGAGFGGGGGRNLPGGFGGGTGGFYSDGGGGLGAGGAVFVQQGGVVTIGAGSISGGSAVGGTGFQAGSGFGSGMFIQGNTTLTLAPGAGNTLTIGDAIADQSGNGGTGDTAGAGALLVASGDVHLQAASSFTGGVTVASGATLDLGNATAAGSGAITLAGDGAALLLDSGVVIGNTLGALSHLDSITLAGITGTGVSVDGSSLVVTTSGATVSFGLDSAAYQTSDFTFTQNGSDAVVTYTACYTAGTRIATPDGEMAVERLREGDFVCTAAGGVRPVRWLGWRQVECRRHPRPAEVQPVRIRAGAVLPGLPARDLVLSPDHAVALDGVLVPARYLLNDATVVQEDAGRVTYYHVELAGPDGAAVHDVLLAEGLPAESYLDTGNRAAFANGGAPMQLHPDFATAYALEVWRKAACAPLVMAGPALEAIRALLDSRAQELGWQAGLPALPVLEVGGETLQPEIVAEGLRFTLPMGAVSAVLRSAGFVPAHTEAASGDHRRLGVAVQALERDGRAVRLADLVEGWHAPEGGLRWTDGGGRIAVDGARVLTLRVAPIGRAWTRRAA